LRKIIKILVWSLTGIVIFILLLSATLLLPSVQLYLTNKASEITEKQFGIKTEIDHIYIRPPQTVSLDGFYIPDEHGDTLLYIGKLRLNAGLFDLLHKKINVETLNIDHITSKINRQPGDSTFNFQFIIDAFSANKTKPKPKSPWKFDVGTVKLQHIAFVLDDANNKLYLNTELKECIAEIDNLDLLNQKILFSDIMITGFYGFLELPDSASNNPDLKTTSKLKTRKPKEPGFLFASNNLNLEDIQFNINNPGSTFYMQSYLKHLYSKKPEITLSNLHINIQEIDVQKIRAKIETNRKAEDIQSTSSPDAIPPDKYLFGDFDLIVKLGKGKITDSYFAMDDLSKTKLSGLDYNHLELDSINLNTQNLNFYNDGVSGIIKSLAISERSGLSIKNLSTEVELKGNQVSLNKLILLTSNSSISGDLSLNYHSLKSIAADKLKFNISISATPLNMRDLSYLVQDTVFQNSGLFNYHNLWANIKTNGSLNDFKINKFNIRLDKDTHLQAYGTIKGLPDIEHLYTDIRLDTFYTSMQAIQQLTGIDSLPGNIQPDETLRMSASLTGTPDSAQFDLHLNTDKGFFDAESIIRQTNNTYFVNTTANFTNLQAGIISGVEKLGNTSGNLRARVAFDSTGLQSAEATLNVDTIFYNDYNYQKIIAHFTAKDKQYNLTSSADDPNIVYDLDSRLIKNDSSNNLDMKLHISKLDLKTLNLINEDLMISGKVQTRINYNNIKKFNGTINIDSLVLVNSQYTYPVSDIRFIADIDSIETNYEISSDVFFAKLNGNVNLYEIPALMRKQLTSHIIANDSSEYNYSPHFDLEIKLPDPNFISYFFLPELKDFLLEKFIIHYNDESNNLSVDVGIPYLTYSNFHLDTLNAIVTSSKEKLEVDLSINKISYDTLSIDSLDWKIHTSDSILSSRITVGDTLQKRYDLGMLIERKNNTRIISFIPGQIKTNGVNWIVPEDNQLIIDKQSLSTQSMYAKSTDGRIELKAKDSGFQILFDDYSIRNIMAILNNQNIENVVSGKINGEIQFIDIFSAPVFSSNIHINDLKSLGSDLGELSISAEQKTDSQLGFEIQLEGFDNYLNSTGNIELEGMDPSLEIKLDMDIKNPGVIQPWITEYINSIDGNLKSNLKITGTRQHPSPVGKIEFDRFSIDLTQTNTRLTINKETINIDGQGLHFGDFIILDSLNNSMTLSGDLFTNDYNSFKYNLSLNTDNFLLTNSTKKNLETLYGRLMIGADIKLTGQTGSPVIDSKLHILEHTDFTYVMTGSDLTLENDEGIVVYSAYELPIDSIETHTIQRSIADSLAQKISGLKLSAFLTINEKAEFTLITNPTAGDYAKVKMSGQINYQYEPANLGTLNGKISFTEGAFDLSFYGLVHKKFIFVPGSFINWSGAVMDGIIQFQAKHVVKTNSIGLIGSEISEAEKASYTQRLPYEVILKVTGMLSAPKFTFIIDLPDSYRSGQPLIDSKLQSLNQEGMENERNRQAFALLVGGTFIPESSGRESGETGFATTAALNSMNSIMTQQLNNISGQIIKGLDVSMGINKIDDYGGNSAGNNTRTQLDIGVNKSFFKDRVLVGVEGHIDLEGNNPVYQNQGSNMTEFIVQYLLTENGSYRIKAFRENAFDLMDGEIQNTGFAFMFVIDFGKHNSTYSLKKEKHRQ